MRVRDKEKMLADLYDEIRRDPVYRTKRMGEVFVPGSGLLEGCPIVFIGEAPGREEEKLAAPFVGAAGKNLASQLREIGLARETVFITNLVKYRPFSENGRNRPPSPAEARRALPYLLKELKLLEPCIVVCLGLSAAKTLLGNARLTMNEANGCVFEMQGLKIMVTYHPSPLNYVIAWKREALSAAFKKLKAICSGIGPA